MAGAAGAVARVAQVGAAVRTPAARNQGHRVEGLEPRGELGQLRDHGCCAELPPLGEVADALGAHAGIGEEADELSAQLHDRLTPR